MLISVVYNNVAKLDNRSGSSQLCEFTDVWSAAMLKRKTIRKTTTIRNTKANKCFKKRNRNISMTTIK